MLLFNMGWNNTKPNTNNCSRHLRELNLIPETMISAQTTCCRVQRTTYLPSQFKLSINGKDGTSILLCSSCLEHSDQIGEEETLISSLRKLQTSEKNNLDKLGPKRRRTRVCSSDKGNSGCFESPKRSLFSRSMIYNESSNVKMLRSITELVNFTKYDRLVSQPSVTHLQLTNECENSPSCFVEDSKRHKCCHHPLIHDSIFTGSFLCDPGLNVSNMTECCKNDSNLKIVDLTDPTDANFDTIVTSKNHMKRLRTTKPDSKKPSHPVKFERTRSIKHDFGSTYTKKMMAFMGLLIASLTVPTAAEEMQKKYPLTEFQLFKTTQEKEFVPLPPFTSIGEGDYMCKLLLLVEIGGNYGKMSDKQIGVTTFTAEHPNFRSGPLKFIMNSDGRRIWREQSFCLDDCANISKTPLLLSATTNLTQETNIRIVPQFRNETCKRLTNPSTLSLILAVAGTCITTVILLVMLIHYYKAVRMSPLDHQDPTTEKQKMMKTTSFSP